MPRGWSRGLLAALGAVGLVFAPVAHADPGGYVVEPGDTLSQIAEKAGVDLAALVKLNELEDANFVVVGQSLKLPAGAAGASSPATPVTPASPRGPASAAAAVASGGANRTYAVEEGDTLSGIAK